MKVIFVFLLAVCMQCVVFGQVKDNIYADAGGSSPGGSVTYDRKVFKNLDVGLGTSLYDFNSNPYHNIRFATYLDFRRCWGRRRNRFFCMADVGMMFYAGRIPDPSVASYGPNSPFIGLGIGYGYRINKRGMGPYISLGADGSWVHVYSHDLLLAPEARDYLIIDIEFVASVGFKF